MTLKKHRTVILAIAEQLIATGLSDEEQGFVASAVAMMAIQRKQKKDDNAKGSL